MDTPPGLPPELWSQTPSEVQAYIRVLEARVETRAALVHTLQEQLRTFQAQLNQTSQHASRPPSSAPPQHRRPGHPQSHRRRGGPPDPPGHTRTRIPGAEVDAVVVRKPTPGTHCPAPFSGDDPTPWRPQVSEIPPITPVVTADQWPQLACPVCGAIRRAPWPAGVPSGTYGPRVQATGARYPGADRLSKRTTQPAMAEVGGVPRRGGTSRQLEQATTEAVAAPVEEARIYVHEQAVAQRDATRGRQGDKRAW